PVQSRLPIRNKQHTVLSGWPSVLMERCMSPKIPKAASDESSMSALLQPELSGGKDVEGAVYDRAYFVDSNQGAFHRPRLQWQGPTEVYDAYPIVCSVRADAWAGSHC